MAKVGIDLSFTFRVGPANLNQFSKVNLSVSDIDTEVPLNLQLEKINAYQDELWKYLRASIDRKIETILED